MLQLQLACEQRIGVIIMGPSGSGKSTLWQVRRAAVCFSPLMGLHALPSS
jgi:ABC-type thiamine transport system ATPase subunit